LQHYTITEKERKTVFIHQLLSLH